MKPRESFFILIIILAIIALGLWRAISISIAHPHLSDFKNQFIPMNPNNAPITSTTTPSDYSSSSQNNI
jgi:hypothetical protein